MKILVTGSKGFIGKHICKRLKESKYDVLEFDRESKEEDLISYVNDADFIIHLAGINRPLTIEEFYDGNSNFTKKLVDLVKLSNKNIPIIFSSSIQAELDNDYGKSKRMGEEYLFNSGLPVYVYRLANVFGKWCRPNYNSACATFCYNIAHDLEVNIRDENYVVHFNYIDDICNEFINIIKLNDNGCKNICYVNPTHDCSLGNLVKLLRYFKSSIINPNIRLPQIHNEFELKLFITFCDYFSDEGYRFNYASDARGSFEEIYKSKEHGQISINMSYPGITKGGHYHTYKNEKFMTVIGNCLTRLRKINTNEILEYKSSGEESKIIDIKPNYTHDIKNIGKINSYTIMWISEIYNDSTSDTFKEDVNL